MTDLLSTKEAAARYGVTCRRVLMLARDRRLEGVWRDRGWWWTREQVEAMAPRPRGAAGHLKTILLRTLEQEIAAIRRAAHVGDHSDHP